MKSLTHLFGIGSQAGNRPRVHITDVRVIAGIAVLLAAGASRLDPYLCYVATSWLIFGLAGLSLDLVWGRGGFLSLCQSSLYGIGGYVGSVAAINFASVTGNTLLWALPAGALVGALAGGLLGAVIFYGRMGPLQGTILTYACTLLLWTASMSLNLEVGVATVGGDNGLSDIPGFVLGFGPEALALTPRAAFVCVLAIAAMVYFAVRGLMRSPFGSVIDCIRMNADKTELLGYDVRRYQALLFALSGAIAGLAGALYGGWSHYLSPSMFSAQDALMVPIYVLVGGLGTLTGPFVGAMLVGGLSFWLGGGVIGGQTTLVMGICLTLLVLFLRQGLLGVILGDARRIRVAYRTQRGGDAGGNEGSPAGASSTYTGEASGHAARSATRLMAPPKPKIDLERLAAMRSMSHGVRPALHTERIVKSFGGVTPVREVSVAFTAGRVQCVIGPNGAGKSSLLRCCTGVYPVDAGRIELNGRDVTRARPFERVRAGIGIKMQVAQVFDAMSVRDNLWVAAYAPTRDAWGASRIADSMLAALGMEALSERLGGELSHGEQQWLDLGMVLCGAPGVVFLDEPAAGMTGAERRELCALIRSLASDTAVIVVEHDMDFVRELDAQVTVLHQGEVFAEGDIQTLRNDERVLDIYLGRRTHVRDL